MHVCWDESLLALRHKHQDLVNASLEAMTPFVATGLWPPRNVVFPSRDPNVRIDLIAMSTAIDHRHGEVQVHLTREHVTLVIKARLQMWPANIRTRAISYRYEDAVWAVLELTEDETP